MNKPEATINRDVSNNLLENSLLKRMKCQSKFQNFNPYQKKNSLKKTKIKFGKQKRIEKKLHQNIILITKNLLII